jgi:hypothetical protein
MSPGKPGFAVATPDPAQWGHVRAFDEAAEAVQQGLLELGHPCARVIGGLARDRINVLFGAHHLTSAALPDDTILFNLEQIVTGSLWLTPAYVSLLRRYRVWDYSALNVAALRSLGVARLTHVPLGHARSLERIAPQDEDIDVLFYGRLIPRRIELLKRLEARGMRVVAINDAYGRERDARIARARIVLNVHVADEARLETARCFYALINGRFVVSENSVDAAESGLAGGMAFAAYADIEACCAWYLERPAERAAIAEAGRRLMRARPQAELLRPAVAGLLGPR